MGPLDHAVTSRIPTDWKPMGIYRPTYKKFKFWKSSAPQLEYYKTTRALKIREI